MENAYQDSVIAQLLEAIINQSTYEGEATSVIAQILLSILNGTPYEGEATSVIAQLFVKLKAKIEGESFEPYEGEPVSNIAKILISIIEEEEYNYPPESRIAELLLELKEELESYTEVTVSGAIANFTTNVAKPLVNLTAYFKATQESGTPTPQSPKTISGVSAVNNIHCGANLWDEDWELGIWTSSGQKSDSQNAIRCKNYIKIKPSKTYYVFANFTRYATSIILRLLDANKSFVRTVVVNSSSTKTFTADSNVEYIVWCSSSTDQITTYNNDVSINYPSSDTEYHAYNPNSNVTLINLGGTYYGGYVSQDKDGKRQLVVTHKMLEWSNLNFRRSNNGGAWANYLFFASVSDMKYNYLQKSDIYEMQLAGNIGDIENYRYRVSFSSAVPYVYFRNDDYTSAEDFVTAMNEHQFLYEITEPIVIDLADGDIISAFVGVNNIYNDSGDTSVTYLYKGEPPVSLSLGKGSTDDENESEYKDTDEPKEVDEPKEKEDNIIKEELKDLDDNQERRA